MDLHTDRDKWHDEVRSFLDSLVDRKPSDELDYSLPENLRSFSLRSKELADGGREQDVDGRLARPVGQRFMFPDFAVTASDRQGFVATVRFDWRFVGGGGAAHGGFVAALFDEVLGQFITEAVEGRSRTAFLKTNYRAVTPIQTDLSLSAEISATDGRKRFVHGELRHGDIVCADVDALFVKLKPGQP